MCKNVRDCRNWKKATQEDVARKAGIDLKRYKSIERAVAKDLTFDEVWRIAKALKITSEFDIENLLYY